MVRYFFHYTSKVAAQMIMAAGVIRPNDEGVVYLTDELFPTGAQAADLLGIPPVGVAVSTRSAVVHLTKPVDLTCSIPEDRLPNTIKGPEDADQFRDWATGEVLYKGKGRQFKYDGEIDIKGLSWIALGFP